MGAGAEIEAQLAGFTLTRSGTAPAILNPPAAGGDGPLPSANQIVYVTKGGDDVTGNGTVIQPYLTIPHAMSTIIDASQAKPYSIQTGPGTFAEAFALKPWVFVAGDTSEQTIVTGAITLDPTFAGGALNIAGGSDIAVNGGLDADFVAAASTHGALQFTRCAFHSTTWNGGGTAGADLDFCSFGVDVVFDDMAIQSSSMQWPTNVTYTATGVGLAASNSVGDTYNNLTLNGDAGDFSVLGTFGSTVSGIITLNGAKTELSTDIQGQSTQVVQQNGAGLPTLRGSGHATAGQINIADGAGNWNQGDAASGKYSPAVPGNWVAPPPTTIAQALDRIAANTTNAHPIP